VNYNIKAEYTVNIPAWDNWFFVVKPLSWCTKSGKDSEGIRQQFAGMPQPVGHGMCSSIQI
jgi:hypothetical protein